MHTSSTTAAAIAGGGAGNFAGSPTTYGDCPVAVEAGAEEGHRESSSGSCTSSRSTSDPEDKPGSVSQLDAYFALVKGNLGPGVLALPFAFSQAGWSAGLPVLLLVVAQGVYAMLVLAECKRAVARPGVTDLGDMAYSALGPCGRHAADIFVFIVQGGVCCCFVNLVAGNLADATGWLNRKWMTFALAPLFAVISLLRFVAQLGFLNKLGSAAMAVAVVAGTVCGAARLHEIGWAAFMARSAPNRPFSDSIMLASSVFFAFEGLGIVLPIEKEMAKPTTFPRVVVLASMTLAAAFVCVAFTCGIAYRGELQSGSIVAFLASQPGTGRGHVFVQVADMLVTAAVFLTYPLQLLPVAEILGKWLDCCPGTATATSGSGDGEAGEEAPRPSMIGAAVPCWVVVRLALVAASAILALTVDNVALLVSLFGAVGQTGLGMLAPICHVALMRAEALPHSAFRWALDAGTTGFCVVIMVFGTYFAFKDILASW